MKIEKWYDSSEYEGKYPENIMEDVRERLGLESDDDSRDKEIMEMSKDKILDEVVKWNGLINYGDTIKNWVQDIYNIDLDSLKIINKY